MSTFALTQLKPPLSVRELIIGIIENLLLITNIRTNVCKKMAASRHRNTGCN